MAESKHPELPMVTMLTDDEMAEAIKVYAARKHLGMDHEQAANLEFRVSYRQVKQAEGGSRAFAAVALLGPKVEPK